MNRLRLMLIARHSGRVCRGLRRGSAQCAPQADQAPADFGKKTADMMKNANSGMDPKKAKADAAAKP